jgi:hypothetical protein
MENSHATVGVLQGTYHRHHAIKRSTDRHGNDQFSLNHPIHNGKEITCNLEQNFRVARNMSTIRQNLTREFFCQEMKSLLEPNFSVREKYTGLREPNCGE